MKKFIAIPILLGGILVYYACNQGTPAKSNIYNAFCYGSTADSTCPIIPIDVHEHIGAGYDSFLDSVKQPPIDVFSWQAFVALNWPADSAGKASGSSIADKPNAPRVWEYYKDPAEVFGYPVTGLTLRLGEAKSNGQKFLYLDSKAPTLLRTGTTIDATKLQGFKEADGHPLIDHNLNFTLYEIKMNPIETSFVIKNGLTTVEGIYTLGKKNGNNIPLPASDTATKKLGTMEIKASWRILLPAAGDDTTRYYCRKATIYIDSLHTRNKKPLLIKNVTVGLTGMHIISKTQKLNASEIWSTFEHIDNTPDNAQEAQQSGRVWSYYNPACLNCTPNKAPDTLKGDKGQYIWETTMPYAVKYSTDAPAQQFTTGQKRFGTQVVRVYPIYKYTELLNRLWQEKLKKQGSVWANYRLISSQWRSTEIFNGPTAPNFLANTTLETFIQNNASCINCHSGASVVFGKDTIKTSMSFIFPVYAKSVVKTTAAKNKK